MKNVILSAIIITSAALTGCNKGGSFSDYRVKQIISGKGQSTEFTYSSDNKVASIKSSDSTKVTFAYNGNSIVQTVSNPMRGMNRTQTLHLTNTGYVDSSVISDPQGNILSLTTHDADGYSTEVKDYFSGVLKRTTKSVFKDGNEITRTIIDETQKPLGTVYIDYYTDKLNSAGNENQGMKFIGKDSKNLIKKVVQVLAKGDTLGSITFSYKFDDKGRVISKATYQGTVRADSTTVTYY